MKSLSFNPELFKKSVSYDQLDMIPVKDGNFNLIGEARAKLREAQMLACAAAGIAKPIAPALLPLSRAIDNVCNDMERGNLTPIPADAQGDNSTLSQRIAYKEQSSDALDQARIAAIVLMGHLEAARTAMMLALADTLPDDSTFS